MFGDVTFAQAPFASLGGNTFSVSASDSATATANFTDQGIIRGGNIAESSAVQDSFVSQAVMRPTQAETATAANVQSVILTALASIQEQAGATAAQMAIGTFLAAQAETTTATAAQTAIGTLLASQAEVATGADSSNRGLLVSVAIAESATGTATQVAQISVNASISEVVSALSTLGVVKDANVYPTGVQLTINIGGALVWAVIDDSQNPNWQNIVNAQGSGWVVINDVQSPGWTQLPS